jgi:endonuclease/exonuclease/phosphatase family metal-dependent hydrolase
MRSLVLLALAFGSACASVRANGGAEQSLRVMSYNIRSGNGDLDATAAVIRAVAPDIVALQEVDVHWATRSDFADQAAALAQRLGLAMRFARIYQLAPTADTMPPREFGVALLSRYPIVGFRNDSLTRLSTQEQNPIPAHMPGLLDATLDINGTEVRALNTHLDYRADPRVRELQVAEILNYLGGSSIPTIVFGDLNAEPTARELLPLFQRLHDSWTSGSDSGFTYPADQPSKRIDYILITTHFRVRSAGVVATRASDHRPVVADLILTQTP